MTISSLKNQRKKYKYIIRELIQFFFRLFMFSIIWKLVSIYFYIKKIEYYIYYSYIFYNLNNKN